MFWSLDLEVLNEIQLKLHWYFWQGQIVINENEIFGASLTLCSYVEDLQEFRPFTGH